MSFRITIFNRIMIKMVIMKTDFTTIIPRVCIHNTAMVSRKYEIPMHPYGIDSEPKQNTAKRKHRSSAAHLSPSWGTPYTWRTSNRSSNANAPLKGLLCGLCHRLCIHGLATTTIELSFCLKWNQVLQ